MRTLSFVTTTLLATTAVSQPIVLPARAALAPPASAAEIDFNTFGLSPRTQLIFETSEIPSVVATWSSLTTRGPQLLTMAAAMNLTLTLAVSPLAYQSMTTSFAGNLGTLATTVFAGTVSFGALPSGNWPAPWQTPIRFAAPFLYVGPLGKSLVIDVQKPTNTPIWIAELYTSDLGSATTAVQPQPSCRFSNLLYALLDLPGTCYAGGSWIARYSGLLPGAPGYCVIGGSASTWGGFQLPLDLTPFGARACVWGVAMDYLIPVTADAMGNAALTPIALPNHIGVAGTRFWDQGLFLDPLANQLGVVPTPARGWTVGRGGAGMTVYTSGSGAVMSNKLTTVMLN